MVLFTFNILPLPPLDGFGVLESLLPRSLARQLTLLRPWGAYALLALIMLGALEYLLLPVVYAVVILSVLVNIVTGFA